MLTHTLIYIASFVGIWIGAGLTIRSVEKMSRNLNLSSFAVSFLILGAFTSVSELSVGVNSVLDHDPEIFVGNLIGASLVLFMLVIPLLAILGRPLHVNSELRGRNLIMSLIVVGTPVLLSLDGVVDKTDGIISVVLFVLLALCIEAKKGVLESAKEFLHMNKVEIGKELLTVIFGVVVIFISSHFVVSQTIYFSQVLGVTPFLVSLLLISIGTNLPELSLVVRSIFLKNNQVAFGDYVGSASFNTFLFGLLTLYYGKSVILANSYLISLVFLILGLMLFYVFARTKNTISRSEGAVLLMGYILFLLTEVIIHSK